MQEEYDTFTCRPTTLVGLKDRMICTLSVKPLQGRDVLDNGIDRCKEEEGRGWCFHVDFLSFNLLTIIIIEFSQIIRTGILPYFLAQRRSGIIIEPSQDLQSLYDEEKLQSNNVAEEQGFSFSFLQTSCNSTYSLCSSLRNHLVLSSTTSH